MRKSIILSVPLSLHTPEPSRLSVCLLGKGFHPELQERVYLESRHGLGSFRAHLKPAEALSLANNLIKGAEEAQRRIDERAQP